MNLKYIINKQRNRLLYALNPKWMIDKEYESRVHRKMNWKEPKDLNEKINWLKIYSDTTEWSRLADKYLVREYIEEKGLGDILVPLYGVWENADDIEFDNLPKSFVIKANHGSGDAVIVEDKTKINWAEVKRKLNKEIKVHYGSNVGEPHYDAIPPRIIAEKLLVQDGGVSSSLIDYKVWCFHGKAHYIWACYNRTKDNVYVETYDRDWNYHPEYSVYTNHYRNGGGKVPRPALLDKLIEIAEKLSEGFPQVRVDFYMTEGKIYFGELTFTSAGGYMTFYTPEFLLEMGSKINLPAKKR